MNLNPFELRENDFYVKDMYKMRTDGWSRLEPTQLNEDEYGGSYEYLLRGINTDVDWKIICYAGSYQGELFCLGEYDNKFYFVNTGYGSCSGCDWYQANDDSISGLQEIQDSLKKDIKEFDTLVDFLDWFKNNEDNWWSYDKGDFLRDIKETYSVE
jgi:hypothetical protein